MSALPVTVPNLLGFLRLGASPLLVVLAFQGFEILFLLLFLFLDVTDWLDGKLAVRLDQRTAFGSRLDTVADAVLYLSLLVGLALLRGGVLLEELPWIGAAVLTFLVAWGASLVRFRVLPSYHAYSAKIAWFATLVAVVALLALDLVWPVRVAAVLVAAANLESVALTAVLDRPRSDVRSLLQARSATGSEDTG